MPVVIAASVDEALIRSSAGRHEASWRAGVAGGRPRTLRVMFNSAETSFDPARIIDLYSRTVTAHIFEALYGYDVLARPAKLVPKLALALPEASDDFRVWTVRLRRDVFFADGSAAGFLLFDFADRDALAAKRSPHQRFSARAHVALDCLATLVFAFPGKIKFFYFWLCLASHCGRHGYPLMP